MLYRGTLKIWSGSDKSECQPGDAEVFFFFWGGGWRLEWNGIIDMYQGAYEESPAPPPLEARNKLENNILTVLPSSPKWRA